MATSVQVDRLCTILRQRSADHTSAVEVLLPTQNYGQVISILRQELDSLVRTVFLLSNDLGTRRHLIEQTLHNVRWTLPGTRTLVTDRDMVNLANRLHGWTNSVYKLGCAFIHLSPLADYRNTNPFDQLSVEETRDIMQHMHQYHDFPLNAPLNMETVGPYLQRVFNKVKMNLEWYINRLQENQPVSIPSL